MFKFMSLWAALNRIIKRDDPRVRWHVYNGGDIIDDVRERDYSLTNRDSLMSFREIPPSAIMLTFDYKMGLADLVAAVDEKHWDINQNCSKFNILVATDNVCQYIKISHSGEFQVVTDPDEHLFNGDLSDDEAEDSPCYQEFGSLLRDAGPHAEILAVSFAGVSFADVLEEAAKGATNTTRDNSVLKAESEATNKTAGLGAPNNTLNWLL